MEIALRFAILGVSSGALIALLALGIVTVHRGARVVNFAQGAFAMVGAYVFYDLHVNSGVSYIPSFIAGVAASGAAAVGTHVFVMRPLRNAPLISRIIACLGVLEILEEGMSHVEPSTPQFVSSSLPLTQVHIFGTVVTLDRLIIVGIMFLLAATLSLVYRHTQFGRATSAALDNRRAIRALGYSPDRLAVVNWLIGGCLAGIAGILLAPITGLSVSEYTLLILPALAAAVVGRLDSLWLAMFGGILIGVMQSEMSFYISAPGWSDAAPFLLILVILFIRGVGGVSRTSASQRLPRVGTGAVRVGFVVPGIVLLLLLTQIVQNPFWIGALVTTIGGAIVLLSFVLVTGYSGQLSLAQFAFAGLGAWMAGKFVVDLHMPLLIAVLLSVVLVFPIGLALGAACLRTSGVNLAIATIGFAAAVEYLVFDSSTLTGPTGITLGSISLFGLNLSPIDYPQRYAAAASIALLVAGVVTANIRRGRSGRRLLIARSNERAAASLGLRVTQARIFAFGIGSAIAALGGIVLGFANTTIVFTIFSTLQSIESVAQAVIGGVGWVAGAGLGGIGQPGGVLTQALDQSAGSTLASYVPLILAVLLIVVLILQTLLVRLGIREPPGSVGANLALDETPARRAGRRSPDKVRPQALEVSDLTVTFGGVTAVSGVSLRVDPGEVVGLIGPNGAGKTTFIDAVAGSVRARTGQISLGNQPMRNMSSDGRARLGLTRSFQSLELFDDMSVLDNLLAASDPGNVRDYAIDVFWPQSVSLSDAGRAAIPEFGLDACLAATPAELPYGTRRLVAIARAVATNPSVLLLDEPAAGLDDGETGELADLVAKLAREWGMGVLLVEHDVEMVMNICDRVYVLELGRLIATGTPSEIRNDERVIRAYLGTGSLEPVPGANRS
jgi:ABC-type branched-subunit amino acid transport system ATPase component/branched-subunit amino acid ABC-type transport system permease component